MIEWSSAELDGQRTKVEAHLTRLEDQTKSLENQKTSPQVERKKLRKRSKERVKIIFS